MARTVAVAGHQVEPKITLLSARRLEQTMGLRPDQVDAAFKDGRFQSANGMSALAWAVVAHHPELAKLSEEELAAQLDLPTFMELMAALASEDAGTIPPQSARGRRPAGARRAK